MNFAGRILNERLLTWDNCAALFCRSLDSLCYTASDLATPTEIHSCIHAGLSSRAHWISVYDYKQHITEAQHNERGGNISLNKALYKDGDAEQYTADLVKTLYDEEGSLIAVLIAATLFEFFDKGEKCLSSERETYELLHTIYQLAINRIKEEGWPVWSSSSTCALPRPSRHAIHLNRTFLNAGEAINAIAAHAVSCFNETILIWFDYKEETEEGEALYRQNLFRTQNGTSGGDEHAGSESSLIFFQRAANANPQRMPPRPDDLQRLSTDELYDLVWSKPLQNIADDFGVSLSAVIKLCSEREIDRPERGYWHRIENRLDR